MLPEPSLGADILSEPVDCTKVCLPSTNRLAMRRLETRVEPDIPRAALAGIGGSGLMLRVKATISETGEVTVTTVEGDILKSTAPFKAQLNNGSSIRHSIRMGIRAVSRPRSRL